MPRLGARPNGSRSIMAEWQIEPLCGAHERAEFSCGHASLDTFLRTIASQYEKRRLGRTYVAVEQGQMRVAGYYTLAVGSVDISCLSTTVRKKLPKHPVPTIHFGRLAVDEAFRGQRLGERLLFHALRAALELSDKLGAFAVDVWALDDAARTFYLKYGFIPLEDNPLHLYLPMKTVATMFDG
jgi:GNAT superfamily N-acetyltransferase